ncbi:aspartyl-phosphate phosphatase Spo0E family protein [Alkalicoccobacillus porphyridii]|uniref:Aspartyl-phosphate phosphatase Spo0E family protein n=1 Tax=Alkalicoccobacillus porphyridii TaxID=2597270 RepID=A0A553ZZX6_9BACI|nr:aspartyl-phosphate phosphatase Spo0E family protein [Alkalicoccobacillus porphyridii]TSB46982.1 aspartyl-phosphate phosphatase Spo0E family protein [Alkalicoccobacillus porphyridii]
MIYKAIEKKRLQMFKLAKEYGMTAERTIRCSQELDQMLNDIQHTPSGRSTI